ncbi:DUF2254 domain-containing protein [Acidocella aminolytica]|uniref:DUF2254 domain-containing protein n=1 Tax=Acidocella aminolytica 101 = DSM 11237 TaxID=1120923 RepID=A0A0D6PIA7_9PROT|nr:DUF2254 domain-containing protein [Acidocella aminolytica]GAN81392.1 hypothetical protein Aam_092_013 [Acidocella aminolytica 101 = DSM 11237]GBQ40856.1 hypothetical protein AA11237_2511 [Acidocella aminolytica 101 = DSM 11237]SHF32595.1 Uncharacterized membrane protein [Acidocella aminolytica 101 = DSM 11237]
MARWLWVLRQLSRKLWVRATLIAILSVVAALLAAVIRPIIPAYLPSRIGANSVGNILDIIASSMLAVTTFSLNVMTSAYGAASSGVTPRATKLLMEDSTTQNVLSTFIGSFLFSIVGLVMLQTGAYGEQGRVVLFIVTIGVIGLIVVSLLHWIDHLTRLGRVGETTMAVEDAARQALTARLKDPYLGGRKLHDPEADIPAGAVKLSSDIIGYVQHIDMGALSALAEEIKAEIYLTVNPGAFAYPYTVLAWIKPETPGTDIPTEALRKAFSLDSVRTFDQDPRFGVVVLSEIASRALSPAVNDPGTAIDVVSRITRLMALWAQGSETRKEEDIKHPRLHVPALKSLDMLEDGFMPIARYGASMVEVQVKLQKGLYALSQLGDAEFRPAVRRYARLCLSHAEAALSQEADLLRVRDAFEGRDLYLSEYNPE